jgi:hypothetical protein
MNGEVVPIFGDFVYDEKWKKKTKRIEIVKIR